MEEAAKLRNLAEKNVGEIKELTKKVNYFRSSKYTSEVIDIFQKSEEYQFNLFGKAFASYNRGAAHVLRQFHHLLPNKKLMCEVFEGSFTDRRFQNGADFIPFSEEELKEIAEVDAQSGEVWMPLAVVKPTFFELYDPFCNEQETSMKTLDDTTISNVEAASKNPRSVEAPTPQNETSIPSSEI